jgi:prepilin-type N-terminal cleavage/methylation domain-containing protein
MVFMVLPMISGILENRCSHLNPLRKAEAMKIYKNKHGLSLIEIMTAVAIIAVLAVITLRAVSHIDTQNNEKKLESVFAQLDGALEEYYDYWKSFPDPNKSPYPTHSAALYGQLKLTPGIDKYLEGINEKLILKNTSASDMYQICDPWGTLLDYRYISSYTFPKIVSAGPDKVFGTNDDIQSK